MDLRLPKKAGGERGRMAIPEVLVQPETEVENQKEAFARPSTFLRRDCRGRAPTSNAERARKDAKSFAIIRTANQITRLCLSGTLRKGATVMVLTVPTVLDRRESCRAPYRTLGSAADNNNGLSVY